MILASGFYFYLLLEIDFCSINEGVLSPLSKKIIVMN